mmetsp:Transcript_19746/g.52790  ORF Transcript_19746/g.52790 Transcript_19746/m.52790 type:complete len:255 (+) Transcript_19746:127-891(+)
MDSHSSSTRSIFRRSSSTPLGSTRRNSRRILSATCREFSYGSFVVPGSQLVTRLRPSQNSSSVSMRMRSPPSLLSLSTTTSHTRTNFLCSVASSMSRAAPPSTSAASCGKVFAFPLPNALVSILWSLSMLENILWSVPLSFSSDSEYGFPLRNHSSMSRCLALSNHSYTMRLFILSLKANLFPSTWADCFCSLTLPRSFELAPKLSALVLDLISCSSFNLSISSCRLSLMPSSASSILMSWIWPSSSAASLMVR